MNICVLSGSPKGSYSITLQTILYLEKKFPQCRFHVFHVGQKIKQYEKDMSEVAAALQEAELVLFVYPVYTFVAPYQLHRFMELLKEADIDLTGKYAAQVTTSKHFYDVTAHGYIRENCADLGLSYIGGLSADMDDLLKEKGRQDAEAFWRYVCHCMEAGIAEPVPVKEPATAAVYTATLPAVPRKEGFETAIVTNLAPEDESLAAMIRDFQAAYPYPTKLINIGEYPFAGGCLGCFHCAVDGTCIYKDNFDTYLREEIQTCAAIVYAFTIKDHSMGASFKRYDDRQFCNGHRTVTMGMPMGYLVNGNLAGEANLRMIIEGRAEVGHNFLAGCGTDASSLRTMANRLAYALETGLVLPQNFYGVGGLKIFRDLIWVMQGMMKADHRFYKAHGFYDFPQKQKATILKMKLVGALLSSPKVKSRMGNAMNDGMIAPYRKVIAGAGRGGETWT